MQSVREISIAPADAHHGDSLVLALQAILRWSGRDVAYDELMAATGIGAMLPFTRRDPCPGRWCDFGRDAFLVDAADDYGLSLRDLHPPDAVPLPGTPPEFELHWRDSYMPLVETALAHGQPVLAWMGWPAPNETQWGIITAVDPGSRRCRGVVAGAERPIELERAAVQAYVAQEFTPTAGTPPSNLRASSAARMLRVLRNELPERFDVETGGAALDRLESRFNSPEFCPAHRSDAGQCLSRLVEAGSSRRRATVGAFRAMGDEAAAAAFSESADALLALQNGQSEYAAAIARIRAADQHLLETLGRVASPVSR